LEGVLVFFEFISLSRRRAGRPHAAFDGGDRSSCDGASSSLVRTRWSRSADAQPDVEADRRYEHAAAKSKVSSAIHQIINEMPPWLITKMVFIGLIVYITIVGLKLYFFG